MCESGVFNLVQAIVKQAAKDYRDVRYEKESYEKDKLEKFFLSKWFSDLTGLDGEMVLGRLKAGD